MHREQIPALIAILVTGGCAHVPAPSTDARSGASTCDASATQRRLQDTSRAMPAKPQAADAEKIAVTMAADSQLRDHLECLMREARAAGR